MNFRTSHFAGIIAAALTVFAVAPSINLATAEPLKITGPEGQTKTVKRQYGPTTSSDTFWSIAQAVKPDNSVTVYQVMSALYDANPHAFSGKNYNSLERGMILLVPSKDVMQQVSKSSAKKRAENNDRGWNNSNQTVAPARVTQPVDKPKAVIQPEVASKASPAEIKLLTEKLEQAEALNLSLTDELARASDEITIGSTDTESFQEEIAELQAENALLKQALQDRTIENEALKSDIAAKQKVIDQLNQPKEQPTSTIWRSLMDNPLLLVLGAVVPALLALVLFWLFIRRRNENEASAESMDDKELNDVPVDSDENVTAADNLDEDDLSLAVHLDTDQTDDASGINVITAPESDDVDLVVEEAADEGQSLDDLWAEAMGEQDGEIEATDDLASFAAESDDLDTLLTGIDEEPKTNKAAADDDLDALLSGFDEAPEADKASEEDDLDALLSGFDEVPAADKTSEEDDLDALLSGFDEVPAADKTSEEDDLDALLSGFDEVPAADKTSEEDDLDAQLSGFDKAPEATNNTVAEDDLDSLLATSSSAGYEDVSDADELDSLLAEFEIKADETEIKADGSDIDALSDEVAAELELPLEIAAELDLNVEDVSTDEAELDQELDTLLANLEAPVDENAAKFPQESIALIDDIAAELETELPKEVVEEGELDSLLAEFNLSDTPADEVLSELNVSEEANTETPETTESDFSLDFDLSDSDITSDEISEDVSIELDPVAERVDTKLADDNMLEFSSEPIEPSVKADKDSGFFDDLKGTKKPEPTALDWNSVTSEVDSAALSDDELLSELAASGGSNVAAEDEELDAFIIEDDSKLTVDQALAALDANESSDPSNDIPEHDLTTFQKDNGFIDIDRLLNEAEEENVETDLYQELDVDMGELDSLMGNTSMVDVDDAENSINAKLDLARAYIEIDDNDSARALLKEVELDGNERQQEEASGLIKELV
ncbi:FimV/HubP family polar landmark protein [Shewanella kaireitica]|uniref:FimV/HubP family polar landmark protein n=1 Tax=Shewanella kaireitica TaxID=212021 RepID=UPI00200D71E6|nr:FimV/HubP family polar landmark protein [Shewanella kaireitica]MCL1094802.1 pilus assembly protein FimV [Shewanella kaireitica]